MVLLGVNIDHVATIRQARRGKAPDPVDAARVCERAGCDSIVCHLREDRRHINDDDVARLRRAVGTRLNLEMSVAGDIVAVACRVRPDQATLVPERRQELTTEGGLDVVRYERRIARVAGRLKARGIRVSLFIHPSKAQIDASARCGVDTIEIHTGDYANAAKGARRSAELKKVVAAAGYARLLGLEVNAGHGLDYTNARAVAKIPGMHELNIGYSIICRSVFDGLDEAVRTMVRAIR